MFKKAQIKLIIFLGVITCNMLQAQTDSIQDNSYYFDDGGISSGKNIIKVNVLSIVHGDLPIQYERILNKAFSIEAGIGLLLPYQNPELPYLFTGETEIEDPGFGYSLWVQPKYYIFFRKAPESAYTGVQLRKRNYKQTIRHTSVTMNYGIQLIFLKRFVFDYSVGIGYRFRVDKSISGEGVIRDIVLPVGIKLGVRF